MIDYLTSTLASFPLSLRSHTARLDSLVPRHVLKKPSSVVGLRGLEMPFNDPHSIPARFSNRAARNGAIDVAAQHETGLYTHEISAISEAA